MGSNSHGQLGLSDSPSRNTPTLVESFQEHFITKVACGLYHSLALTEGGAAYSWGNGKFGALGHGRSDNAWEPLEIG